MISDVIARSPEDQSDIREKLANARIIIRDMENFVRSRDSGAIPDHDRFRFNEGLNAIQSDVEEMASNIGFGGSQRETR